MANKEERRQALKKRWAKEYLRCRSDAEYFMRKYCYIQNQKEGGKIKFDLYPFQERALSEIRSNRFNIILKSRQMGISTLMAGYALHEALFNNDCNVTIVALKQDVAKGLLKKVKIMHRNLPAFMREGTPVDNQYSVEFENGSFIQAASSTSSTAGRSESLSLLIIDEAAFIKNAGELWSSVKPTLSTGGKAVVLSTPYGVGSWYHQTWVSAVDSATVTRSTENLEVWEGTGSNNFHPIKLHWSLHPERDEAWREDMGQDLAPREAAREFDCVSGSALTYTRRGLIPLRDVQIGDLVLTHMGRFRPVTNKQCVFKEDVRRVRTRNNQRRCTVSAEHPVMTPGGWAETGGLQRDSTVAQAPRNIDLSDFFTDNMVEVDASGGSERNVPLSRDVGWLVGLFIRCGALRGTQAAIRTACVTHQRRAIHVVKQSVDSGAVATQTPSEIVFNSLALSSLVRALTTRAGERCLSRRAYALANARFLSGALSGLSGSSGAVANGATLDCVSEETARAAQFISTVLGHATSVTGDGDASYTVSFSKDRRGEDGYSWTQAHTSPAEAQDLYDIEVDQDESFVTEHFVAHNCSFESSGNTVIDPELLKDDLPKHTMTPRYKVRIRGQNSLWVWGEPEPGTRYVIGADVARGDADDYSACSVFDIDSMRQVCEYRGHVRPSDYGDMLCRLGAKYNTAVLVVERNSLGWETLGAITRAEYPRTLWTSNNLQHVDISAGGPERQSVKPGINTSTKTKNQMVIKFEEWVRKNYITIRSTRLIEELRTFVWLKPDKAGHMEGYNDDTVMASCFAVWARDSALRINQRDRDMSESSVRNIQTKSHRGMYGGRRNPYTDPTTNEDVRWLMD